MREHRKARGLTLEQVAKAVGCSTVQVSDLERGMIRLSTGWMQRFAPVLGVEPGDLLLEGDNGASLSVDERELVERFRAADPETRAKIRSLVELMAPANGNSKAASAA